MRVHAQSSALDHGACLALLAFGSRCARCEAFIGAARALRAATRGFARRVRAARRSARFGGMRSVFFLRRWALVIAFVMALVAALPSAAQPWGSKRFVYRAEDKPLTDVLQDFAASQGVPIAIDPQVKGRVSAQFDARPEEFLQAVSKAYGLLWYHDRSSLFVYPSSAMQSRIFRLKTGDGSRVAGLMRTLEVGDARFVLRYNKAEQTLFASGPPRHIEIVASVVESLEQGLREDGATVVRVFPLRHAVAADRKFGDNVSPGMVTLLSQLLAPEGAARRDSSSELSKAQAKELGLESVDPVAPTALERMYGTKTPGPAAKASRGKPGGMFVLSSLERDRTPDDRALVFQADEGTNSVVVHGPVERMAQIEKLIQQLDQPQTLVEIEAAIIDVSTEALDSLGINWSLATSGGSSISVAPTTSNGPQLANVVPLIAGATNITTLVANAGRQLMASVRALEGQGQARVVARPKVLGAENRVATMVDKRIASVRVAGNLDARLFSIEAGTTLQVLPQLVPGDGARQVKLSLRIQDGNFEGQTVDQVPLVKRTEINTEAVIREGESLLLGGISVETETKGRSGVPGLSRVPLVGGLFRVDDQSVTRRERLFLLTPKIIGSAHSAAPVGNAQPLPAPAVVMAPAPVPSASQVPAPAPTPAPSQDLAAVRRALGLNESNEPQQPAVPAARSQRKPNGSMTHESNTTEPKTSTKGVRL
jgi:type III secretion protein C